MSALLQLPAEIRISIWRYATDYEGALLQHATVEEADIDSGILRRPSSGILLACRQTYVECIHHFFEQNLIRLPIFEAASAACAIHQPFDCVCKSFMVVGGTPELLKNQHCGVQICFDYWSRLNEAGKHRRLHVAKLSLDHLRRLSILTESLPRSTVNSHLRAWSGRLADVLYWLRGRTPHLTHLRLDQRLHHDHNADFLFARIGGAHNADVMEGADVHLHDAVHREKPLLKAIRSISRLLTVDWHVFPAPYSGLPDEEPQRRCWPGSHFANEALLTLVTATIFPRAAEVRMDTWTADALPFYRRCFVVWRLQILLTKAGFSVANAAQNIG